MLWKFISTILKQVALHDFIHYWKTTWAKVHTDTHSQFASMSLILTQQNTLIAADSICAEREKLKRSLCNVPPPPPQNV